MMRIQSPNPKEVRITRDFYSTVEEYYQFEYKGQLYCAGRLVSARNYWQKPEPRSVYDLAKRAKELLDEGGLDRLLDEFCLGNTLGETQFYPRDRKRTDK